MFPLKSILKYKAIGFIDAISPHSKSNGDRMLSKIKNVETGNSGTRWNYLHHSIRIIECRLIKSIHDSLCSGTSKEHIDRYANKFVAFRTILDVLEEFYPNERNS